MIITKSEYEPKTGDMVIVWGKGIVSGFLTMLMWRLFGIKKPATHVEMVVDDERDISAGAGGVAYIERQGTIDTAKRIVIVRHSRMTNSLRRALLEIVFPRFIGKSYDYFLYILWVMRCAYIMNPVVHWALYPFRDWLKKHEKISYTCSELVSAVLGQVDIPTGFKAHRNVIPHHYYIHAIASPEVWQIVFEKEEEK